MKRDLQLSLPLPAPSLPARGPGVGTAVLERVEVPPASQPQAEDPSHAPQEASRAESRPGRDHARGGPPAPRGRSLGAGTAPPAASGRQGAAPASALPRSKRLELALRAELGEDVRVVLTDNRSTLLSQSRRKGVRTVRVHQMFLDGDDRLFVDLARFMAHGDRRAGSAVDRFIESRDHLLDHHVRELDPDAHLGEHHDLLAIFSDLNGRYFRPPVRADITWGAGSRLKGARSSITLGTYDDRSRRIQIHPALDQDWVPRLCVARIVHHEMLHAKHPPRKGADGRREVHGPAFRREEAGFEGAEQADVWFDLNLDRLLRYRPRKAAASRTSRRTR